MSDDTTRKTSANPDLPDTSSGGEITEIDPGAVESTENTDGTSTTAKPESPSRLAGLLALILGVLGCLIALLCAFLALRVVTGAGDTVEQLMTPVEASFDRLDERIDQIDDLIDSGDTIPADRVEVFRARVDGLVDVAESSRRGFEAVDDNPLYRLLPADLAGLDESLARFRTSADAIESAAGSTAGITPAAAATVAAEVDDMQARVADTRSAFTNAGDSLRTWLRLGGLAGFGMSLWSLWAQSTLARRGWRGLRARPL